jgi:hypothetical protein
MRTARYVIAAILVTLPCTGAGLWAQPAPARQLVTGVVQDQTGAVLLGAEVTLVAAAGMSERTSVTDASGSFRFESVPAGTYEIRARYEGFKPAAVRLRVGTRAPSKQRIVLALEGVNQEITVGTEAEGLTTEAGQNRNAVTVDRKMLADLPAFDRDYIGAVSAFLDPGALGTGGATLVVDGMEARKVGVSASAIQQIKINQDPYAAEFARPGQGRIEVVTKAGAQEYSGEVNVTFRDARLNARNALAPSRPPEQRRIYEGSFGGPIGDGKTTSFLVSANREEQDLQAIIYAQGPTGLIQATVPTPQRAIELSGSISHQVGKSNTFSLRVNYQTDSARNEGVGGTTIQESGSNTTDREVEVVLNHRAIISKKLVNQFRLLYGQDRQPTTSLSQAQRIVVQDAFTGGGAQNDSVDSERHFTLNETLTYVSGRHLARGGVAVPDWSWRTYDDRSNFGGTFSFSSLEDYALGRPYSFSQMRGDPNLSFVRKMFAAFVQDEIAVRKNLSISIGLRYDWLSFFGDNNNFAPRVSFAWAPGRKAGTVIRGGAGVFFDRTGEGPVADVLRSREGRLFRYVLLDPGFPEPLAPGSSLATQPTSLVQLSPDLVIPYTLQFGLGIERQIGKATTVVVNYTRAQGYHLFRSRDLNAPPPPLYAVRPDPTHGVIRQVESAGRQRSQSLQVALRGKITRFFSGSVQYVLGRAFNDTSGIGSMPANNFDMASEWSRADFDERHRFDVIGTIKPGGWFTLGVNFSARSGRPYSLRTGRDDFNTGNASARPAGVARNTMQGPGSARLDLRWSREIALGRDKKDGPKLTVGIDGFNVLNRVNFSNYVGNMSSPFFGRATSAQPPRRLQLSLRIEM